MSSSIQTTCIAVTTCCIGFVAAHFALSQRVASEAPKTKSTYLVVYRPGPAWLPGKPISEQPLKEHGRYMLSLYKQGKLKFAGPFSDNSGGAVAFEAANDDEAKAVVSADPAASHVFVTEMRTWDLVNWEQYLNRPAQLPAQPPQDKIERARVALVQALPRMDGEHLKATLVEVNYGPGEASSPHSHPCAVVGYVVEGRLRTQVKGEAERIYAAGESFYEAPNGVHLISANASSTEPAKLIAYLICDHDTPLSVDVSETIHLKAGTK